MQEQGVILGAGISGVGAALLAKQQGVSVFVSDASPIASTTKSLLDSHQIHWEEAQHSFEKMRHAHWVMKSPGIPNNATIVKAFEAINCPVISEIELATRYTNATIIGITGSNGKTTTTLLTHHILKNAGLNAGIAGNIGKSFAQQVAEENHDIYVLEISSFQLDHIQRFAPDIAVITNITPDHLDRYNNDFSAYVKAKLKITENQQQNNLLLFNSDDPVLEQAIQSSSSRAKKHPFGMELQGTETTTTVENDQIKITRKNNTTMIPTTSFPLMGRHNLLNAMAAATIADVLNVRKEVIRESLQTFKGVPHRLEKVLTIGGVHYINDSKATNVNATYYALECMEARTVWIAGGVDKGNHYADLLPLVHEKVKAIVCLGVSNQKLLEEFSNVVDIMIETTSMEEAVKIAKKIADRKENVLLSPACASFDLFDNYEDRGNQFKQAVRNL